jgi:hypothetical protein
VTPLLLRHARIAAKRAPTEALTGAPLLACAPPVVAVPVVAPPVVAVFVAVVLVVVALLLELAAAALAAVLAVVEDELPHAVRPAHASRTSAAAVAPTNFEDSLLRWDIELLCIGPT